MLTRILPALLAVAAVAAGCGRSAVPLPDGPGKPGPIAPSLADPPTFPMPAGAGRDGPLDVTGILAINTCAAVTGSTGTLVFAGGDSTGFAADRFVVVAQTQAAFAASGDPADVGDASSAGAWEIARVASVLPAALILESVVSRAYRAGAQACTVPELDDVVVRDGGELVAAAWDGERGGVLAFQARTLSIEDGGLASAAQAGFRGGSPRTNVIVFDVTALDTTGGQGGGKGEGLDPRSFALEGRGNLANGAGGGNGCNAGGAGGGNGGAGGAGGCQYNGTTTTCTPSTGGLSGSRSRIGGEPAFVFGGGGGAGQRNDNGDTSGGAGGGIVLVVAGTLSGEGDVSTSGGAGRDSSIDGAGGGGAGGTIGVWAEDARNFTGRIAAPGGDGGDESYGPAGVGPGAGGGGGVVFFVRLAGTQTPVEIDVEGGQNGVSAGGGGPWGASAGEAGTVSVRP